MRIATLVLCPPSSKEASPHCGLGVVAMTGRDDRRRFSRCLVRGCVASLTCVARLDARVPFEEGKRVAALQRWQQALDDRYSAILPELSQDRCWPGRAP